ncbi:MAG: choice-of-anchor P family protein, partial [Acidimicrobiales bacterium]
GLNLASGAIAATTVKATSTTTSGASSGSTIENLVIAGTNVCSTLGLTATCSPPPNTVLVLDNASSIVVLNEQLDQNGLRVNAVHIYVIGAGNPFGLPAGAEIVISSAYSGTTA